MALKSVFTTNELRISGVPRGCGVRRTAVINSWLFSLMLGERRCGDALAIWGGRGSI